MRSVYTSTIHRLIYIVLFFFFLIQLSGCGHRLVPGSVSDASYPCSAANWPHEASDLEPDPSIHFGRLENGIRYLLFMNRKPENRAALFLNVQAGSLHETEQQLGLAHYLEHMLFNGTENFPPGELIAYLQSIGMGLGADSNAHTAYEETVYKLQLPDTQTKTVDKGLLVLADYAAGALLLEQEVDRERAVILSEKRARDSVGMRVRQQQLAQEFEGTLLPDRQPIGIESVITNADAQDLRQFYDAWYRPDNMVVVAVGQIDIEATEKLIAKHFGSLSGRGEPGKCPVVGKVLSRGQDVLYLYEPELGNTHLKIGTVYNRKKISDGKIYRKQQLAEYVAMRMLQNRLDKVVRNSSGLFVNARVHSGLFLQRYGYASLGASVESKDWKPALSVLQTTLASALETGFYQHEFKRVKKDIVAMLQQQVSTKDSRNSMSLAMRFITDINNNDVSLAPEQEYELYNELLAAIPLEEINQSFHTVWDHERRLIQVVGTADLRNFNRSAETVIVESLYHKNALAELDWQSESGKKFPYLKPPGELGKVTSQNRHDHIEVESFVIEGGVRLNLKKTTFEKNQVLLKVNFGKGKLTEPKPGAAMLAERVLEESGLGELTIEQLKEALAGSSISLGFNVDPQSFSFAGGGPAHELELMIQLLYTYLKDPAFRQAAYQRSQHTLQQMYEKMARSLEGNQRLVADRFFTNGNPFYSMPEKSEVMKVALKDITDWLVPVFEQAELEINIVGDIDVDEVLVLILKYFGSEKRQPSFISNTENISFPAGEKLVLEISTKVDKAMLSVGYLTDDFWNVKQTRTYSILASVLKERLREKLREEMGAVYSIGVENNPSRTHNNFGVLTIRGAIQPELANKVQQVIVHSAADLAETEITQQQLQRVIHPVLTSIRDMQRNNRYWLYSVLSLSARFPEKLSWPVTLVQSVEQINPKMIKESAAQVFLPGSEATLLLKPRTE